MEQTPEGLLERALRGHDWHYHFSDDGSVSARGEAAERELLDLAARCAPAHVRELWARYYPTHGSPALPAFATADGPPPDPTATSNQAAPRVESATRTSEARCTTETLGVPDWDQAEAERMLAELRAAVAAIERTEFGGRPPPPVATVLADALAIAEGYVRDHEAEAARGWDALALLRSMLPHVRRCIGNWKKRHEPRRR
jgi:hypothetical protein